MRFKKACWSALTILCIPALISAGLGRGEITGSVTFTGTPAKPQLINMSKFPDCVKLNPKPRMTEDVLTGSGSALQNVVVYISGGASAAFSPSPVPAIFDQKDCHFLTHVLVLQPGQELQMSNHDPLAHNIHPWMRGYFAVLRTNYFAVTGEDGRFRLPELPPGNYTVTAWHEVFGTQSKEIAVGAGQETSVNFVFQAKPE